ncbi:MAG: RHS repeat protein [Bacteroidales bacterium]|nr:RHS repeat protein [Bacteroidales bacterium]
MTYDDFGNNTTVRVTSKDNADDDYPTSKRLIGYIYESSVNDHAIQNGRLQQMKYPNGNTVDYTYDLFDRVSSVIYNKVVNENSDLGNKMLLLKLGYLRILRSAHIKKRGQFQKL